MRKTDTAQLIVGAIGGLVAGYVLWLVAISIGDDLATVAVWSVTILVISVVLGAFAAMWGLWLRRRRNHFGAAFAFGLPVLPVALTLAVLADLYL